MTIEISVRAETAKVRAGERAAKIAAEGIQVAAHSCDAEAVQYVSEGALGHGWECGVCGAFLQAG